MTLNELWEINSRRPWVAFLYREYLLGAKGKDFDTIRHWIEAFKRGEKTTIHINKHGVVEDGNHRLVAAKIAGIELMGCVSGLPLRWL